jgi:hypothetical protein
MNSIRKSLYENDDIEPTNEKRADGRETPCGRTWSV